MMLSQIRLGNEIHPDDDSKMDGSRKNLKGFNMIAFNEMEEEYEANTFSHPYNNNTLQKMANICCNVISNGNFNPKDRADYLKGWNIKLSNNE